MLIDIILVSVLAICLATDLKSQKIYNKVIFPFLAVAFVAHLVLGGVSGIKMSLNGFVTGVLILIFPYLLGGGIGAGDVKLLALVGALKGSTFVLNTAIYMALIGGVIALAIILLHKEMVGFFKGIFYWVLTLFNGARYKLELPTSPFLEKYPYGVAIVGGAVICLVFKGAWII